MTLAGVAMLLGLITLLAPLAAGAGAPRVILAEDFNATWCPYCPHARCALEQMLDAYPAALIVVEEHWQDALATPWTEARKSVFYALSGLPLVVLDGTRFYFGASSCEGSAASYRGGIEQRLADAPLSPVRIDGAYALDAQAPAAMLSVSILLEEPADLGETTAFLLVLEDEVASGGETYRHVTRIAREVPVTLLAPGDRAQVHLEIPLDAVSDLESIDLIAFLQRTDGDQEVHQAARLTRVSAIPEGIPGQPERTSAIARVAPNPYSPGRGGEPLRIALHLAGESGETVRLDLIDASGRLVAGLLSGPQPAGEREVTWRAANRGGIAAGLHFLRLSTPSGAASAPLLLIP